MKTKTLTLACALLAAAVSAGSPLMANPSNNATLSKTSTVKENDREFFEKAAKSGEKEVAVSQAAYGQLMSTEVRAFSEKIVMDHTVTNNELRALAVKKGVTLPAPDSKIATKWSDKTKNVDKDYVDEMVSDHKNAVELFEKASKSDDAEIATYARATLPKLQHHLEAANGLKSSVK